ncbi:MAG: glycosyltransferase family 4 protein [Gemmatimonadaceae bacterium]
MRQARLLHITTIPMSLTFLRGQVGYMKERGIQVHAMSSPGPDLAAFGSEEHVQVHAVDMPRRITPGSDVVAIVRIWRVIRRIRPDIVHAHTPKGGLLGMIASALARTPVRVYHMRGLPMMGAAGMKRRLLRLTESVSCRLAHSVICVSHSVREIAVSDRICPPDKIRVLLGGSGNGVDATGKYDPARVGHDVRDATRDRLAIPRDAVVIGFVGRLVRDKGLVELHAAWRALRTELPGMHLLLVGPFEPQDPVPPGIRADLEADARVHLAGMDWNTPPLYAAMDLAVLPTYREGFPNVPLEAAAMGLPVVATRVPGCIDAIEDGVTGLLVPPRDADSLADAIWRYARDAGLRRQHGAAGRARVLTHFRREAIWEAIHAEYLRLLRGQAPGFVIATARPRAADGAGEATR